MEEFWVFLFDEMMSLCLFFMFVGFSQAASIVCGLQWWDVDAEVQMPVVLYTSSKAEWDHSLSAELLPCTGAA